MMAAPPAKKFDLVCSCRPDIVSPESFIDCIMDKIFLELTSKTAFASG